MLEPRRSLISLASDTIYGASESILRALAPAPEPLMTSGGAITYCRSEFDPEHAMSAIAGYPWARVGIMAKAVDLSGIPLIAIDDNGDKLEKHWFIDLMKRPDKGWSGTRWRRQMWADLKASGNFYARKIGAAPSLPPSRLKRLHPSLMKLQVDAVTEEPLYWVYRETTRYSLDEIMHIADVSWRSAAGMQHIGESPIRPLAVSIQAAIDARRQAGKAAKRGRLEMLLSAPRGASFGRKGADDLKAAWLEGAESGAGVYVATQGVVATPLSLTARDTEWALLDERTRDETLSVLGVPPVRAQLPSANYGAARQEMRQYWETNIGDSRLVDDEFSYLAGVTIKHSFEAVEALQTSYTERLTRAVMWHEKLGATPYDAAQTEQFLNPPLVKGEPGPASRSPTLGFAMIGQITSMQAIVSQVVAGEIGASTAQAMLELGVGMTAEGAAKVVADLVASPALEMSATAARAHAALRLAAAAIMAEDAPAWSTVAGLVACSLGRAGVPEDIATHAAQRAADSYESNAAGGHRIECDTLPVFGTEHADLIAREMESAHE
jgi:hypothetical protein